MQWITFRATVVLWCIALVIADVSELKQIQNTNKAVTRLDPVLRKALLRALRNLNDEEGSTEENTTVENVEDTTGTSEVLEQSTSPTDDDDRQIHFHSFIVDASNNSSSNSQSGSSEEEIIQTIIIKKPKTTLTPPFFSEKKQNLENVDPIKEADNDIEIDSVQVARSVATSVSANDNKVTDQVKSSTKPLPSPTPTTTTTEAPVTNADGENIEKAEEVKIFQAPLVSAFTVQQDEQGQLKQVISHFNKNTQSVKSTEPVARFASASTVPVVTTTLRPTTLSTSTQRERQTTLSLPVPDFLSTTQRNDFIFDTLALQEKRRQLEEQIAYLQAQQRQQEELIRQQQLLAQQQSFQRQHQQTLFSQRFQFDQNQQPQQRFQVEQRTNTNSNGVQFLPSVQLPTRSIPISVEQQLPVKEPVDFRSRPARPFNPLDSGFNPNQNQNFNQAQQQFNNAQSSNNLNFQQVPSISSAFPQAQLSQQQQQPLSLFNQIPVVTIQKSKEQEVPSQLSSFPILPQKSATNFQTASTAPLPPLLNSNLQLPLKSFQPFRPLPQNPSISTFNNQQSSLSIEDAIARDLSKNRVFRNDASQTGNFGFNQQQQQQQQQQQSQQLSNFNVQQSFRPSQSFSNFQSPPQSSTVQLNNFNDQQQIQNLLLRSGVSFNQRSAEEDFNIISKVLALNHGIQPSQTNNLGLGFSNSRRFR